jgi:hypothetical protein
MLDSRKVFLGGTCAGTTWRDELIPTLQIPYFNPVVKDWTPECQELEELEKNTSGIHLYVITSKMEGVYSIAEAIDSSHTEWVETVFQVMPEGFTQHQMKSLKAVADMVQRNGGTAFIEDNLTDTAYVLNFLGNIGRDLINK